MRTIFKVRCANCEEPLELDAYPEDGHMHAAACLCFNENTGIMLTVIENVGMVEGNQVHCTVWNEKFNQYLKVGHHQQQL